jgi:hypothetical protein
MKRRASGILLHDEAGQRSVRKSRSSDSSDGAAFVHSTQKKVWRVVRAADNGFDETARIWYTSL